MSMVVVGVLVAAAWAILVARMVAFRATITARAMLLAALAGIVLGTSATVLLDQATLPYTQGAGLEAAVVVLTGMRVLVLLTPVLAFRRSSDTRRSTSISDAFLVAFLCGLGYEAIGLIMHAANVGTSDVTINALPPFTISGPPLAAGATPAPTNDLLIAGMTYWVPFVAVVIAAARRFTRRRWLSALAGVVAFAAVTFDAATLAFPAAALDVDGTWAGTVMTLSLHGRLLPWLTIVLAVGLAVLERFWVARHPFGELPIWPEAVPSTLLTALAQPADLSSWWGRQRLVVQYELLGAERAAGPDDEAAFRLQRRVFEEITDRDDAGMVSAPTRSRLPMRDGYVDLTPATKTVLLHGLPLLVIAALVHTLTDAQVDQVRSDTWEAIPFSTELFVTVLTPCTFVFGASVIWRFLRTGAKTPDGTATDAAVEALQDVTLRGSLALVFVSMFVMGRFAKATAWPNLADRYLSTTSTGTMIERDLITLMVVTAAFAAGVAAFRTSAWKATPIRRRRVLVLRNSSALLCSAALLLVMLHIEPGLDAYIHANYAASLFDHFGPQGNAGSQLLAALATAVVVLAIGVGARIGTNRVVRFFTEDR
jgi:hypothetical protein